MEIIRKLQGKIALVTGGSRSIGAAIARRLAQDGATVAITYNASPAKADEVVAAIEAAGDLPAAKAEVLDLAGRLGFFCIDLGTLAGGGRLSQFPGGPLPALNLVRFGGA